LGTAIDPAWVTDPSLGPLLKAQYGLATPTSALDWDGDDDWATWSANVQAWGLPFRGPRIAGGRTPARLATLGATALDVEFSARVRSLAAGRRSVRPLSWDVAGNLFSPSGAPEPSPFRQVWGPDWVSRALSLARSADPTTPLFLAQDGALGLNPRSDALYRLAVDLRARGLPLAGVALGGRQRLLYRDPPAEVGANLKRFTDLGLVVDVYDWDYGLAEDRPLWNRSGGLRTLSQGQAYREAFAWFRAFPGVRSISVAEPSDRFVRADAPAGGFFTPAPISAEGVPKEAWAALTQGLADPRPSPEALAAEARAADPVPLALTAGWPLAWRAAEVWHEVPVVPEGPGGLEHRRRAVSPSNPDDLAITWYLSWAKAGLVFQGTRQDDKVLPGNRGEAWTLEVRGPGFAWAGTSLVGEAVEDGAATIRWSGDGRTFQVTFTPPADAGWGPGTLVFFRFQATDVDKALDAPKTLVPWPTPPGAPVPWKAFQVTGGTP